MRVGLIGCGTVGTTIAARLLRAGHELVVHDRDAERVAPLVERGARPASDLPTLATTCDAIVSALPGPREVEAVALGPDGILAHAAATTIYVETSTIGPASILRLAPLARERRIRLIDAPISRGAASEEHVQLVLWVGAHADHFELARPLLEQIGDHVRLCGGVGQGQVVKLVNNLVAHALVVVLGEALLLGVKAGAQLEILWTALGEGTAQSRVGDDLLPASLFRRDWRPGLKLDHAIKDLELAQSLAVEHGIALRPLAPILDAYRRAAEQGWGNLSAHAVIRCAEEEYGAELRSRIFER